MAEVDVDHLKESPSNNQDPLLLPDLEQRKWLENVSNHPVPGFKSSNNLVELEKTLLLD